MDGQHSRRATVFKAFCDEKRLQILDLLRGGEKCVCTLTQDTALAQSTLSYHMKILCESGIVQGRQAGKWTYYRIDEERLRIAADDLRDFASPRAPQEGPGACDCGA